MWIKNLTVFLGSEPFAWTRGELDALLADKPCPDCGEHSLSTQGFVPPIKGDYAKVHSVDGMLYCTHQEIERLLPAPVVAEELDERAEALRLLKGGQWGARNART